jgi:hypothetical protein
MQDLSRLTRGPAPGSSMSASNTVTDTGPARGTTGSESEASAAEAAYTVDPFSHAADFTPTVMHPEGPRQRTAGDPWTYTSKTWVEGSDQAPGGRNQRQSGSWSEQ